MRLKILQEVFVVCKLEEKAKIDFSSEYIFVAKTNDELSLVCQQDCVPAEVISVERNWRALRIEGQLDFSLIGILAGIAQVLAQNKISIFVVSTFDTDYILLKNEKLEQAISVLEDAGYAVAVN